MDKRWQAIEMEEVTDARELAAAQKQRERFDRNSAWLQRNISEIMFAVIVDRRAEMVAIIGGQHRYSIQRA